MASLLFKEHLKRDRAMRILEHARKYISHTRSIFADQDAADAYALLWSVSLHYWCL